MWNSKTPRVAKSDIIQNYDIGGFQMICLDTFSKSLKIAWVPRFYDNAEWKHVIIDTLPDASQKTDFRY